MCWPTVLSFYSPKHLRESVLEVFVQDYELMTVPVIGIVQNEFGERTPSTSFYGRKQLERKIIIKKMTKK